MVDPKRKRNTHLAPQCQLGRNTVELNYKSLNEVNEMEFLKKNRLFLKLLKGGRHLLKKDTSRRQKLSQNTRSTEKIFLYYETSYQKIELSATKFF